MRKLLRNHPILAWAIVALLALALLRLGSVEYDDMPFGLLIITSAIWGWMYWLPSEMLFALNGGRAGPYHDAVSVIAGLLVAGVVDMAIREGRTWRKNDQDDGNSA